MMRTCISDSKDSNVISSSYLQDNRLRNSCVASRAEPSPTTDIGAKVLLAAQKQSWNSLRQLLTPCGSSSSISECFWIFSNLPSSVCDSVVFRPFPRTFSYWNLSPDSFFKYAQPDYRLSDHGISSISWSCSFGTHLKSFARSLSWPRWHRLE